jgi:hypothetical protein
MIAQAEVRNASAIKSGRVELRHGAVSSLPFADNTFHKAMAVNSMQIWPDTIAGLREMWRARDEAMTGAYVPVGGVREVLAEKRTPVANCAKRSKIERDFSKSERVSNAFLLGKSRRRRRTLTAGRPKRGALKSRDDG